MTTADLVDLSGRQGPRVVYAYGSKPSRTFYRFGWDEERGCGKGVPFPQGSRGFLYYEPRNSFLGSVALRLAASPADIHTSSNLLLPNGTQWGMPLLDIVRRFPGLRRRLHEEQLVSEETMSQLEALVRRASIRRWSMGNQIISSLGDTFELDLGKTYVCVHVLRLPDYIGQLHLRQFFRDRRGKTVITPYTGSILCRFEKADDPDYDFKDPSLCIRVIKELRPIQSIPGYDGWLPRPVEGELLRSQGARSASVHTVWSCDAETALRKKTYNALVPLFEDA